MEPFPTKAHLAAQAKGLEALAAVLSKRLPRLGDRDQRREGRKLLQRAYRCGEDLGEVEPGSQRAALAMRTAESFTRTFMELTGGDPLQDVPPMPERTEVTVVRWTPPSPVRLPWPIRYDLARFEKMTSVAWKAWERAEARERVTTELEERAHRAAALQPGKGRLREDVIDMDGMELARSRRGHKG